LKHLSQILDNDFKKSASKIKQFQELKALENVL